MSRDPEDDDHTTFLQFGDAPIVSRAAFQLHSFGIVQSVQDGTPGFVSDDYLNAISAETTITAAELCTAGLWHRVDGGYEIHEDDMVQMAVKQVRQQEEIHAMCTATGGHEPSAEDPRWCGKCYDWLK